MRIRRLGVASQPSRLVPTVEILAALRQPNASDAKWSASPDPDSTRSDNAPLDARERPVRQA